MLLTLLISRYLAQFTQKLRFHIAIETRLMWVIVNKVNFQNKLKKLYSQNVITDNAIN